jgi:2-aminoadipate transaminase
LHASPIREILSVVDRPGMISFAGGLPSPDSFPGLSLAGMPRDFLQYGPSEGEWELRQRIAEELRERGLRCTADQVIVTSEARLPHSGRTG